MEPEGLVRAFLQALTEGAEPHVIGTFYHPDAEQVEYPNRVVPNGITRDRAAVLAASAAGAKVLRSQKFDVVSLTSAGSFVALEAIWTGTLAIGFGNLQPGAEMTAHFAQFYEIADGKILRQRNYDCFMPF